MSTFNPEELDLEQLPMLGRGVWGSVLDLGDGTVLKLGKRSGGIGDGHEKFRHEAMVLDRLAQVTSPIGPLLPVVVEWDVLNQAIQFEGEPHTIWMRQTKLAGRLATIDQVLGMRGTERRALAASVAESLAGLYGAFERAGIAADLRSSGGVADFQLGDIRLEAMDRERLEKFRRIAALLDPADDHPIHGDFNISNILLDNGGKVVGVVDFAETRLGRLEEDLCSITSEIPALRQDYVERVEAASGRRVNRQALEIFEIGSDMISMILARYRFAEHSSAGRLEAEIDRRLGGV
ncbi:MAG: phosphotransferase [Rhodospirillales bacterium]|nr:phosphotransferase [Rhodospirillales bacterium]